MIVVTSCLRRPALSRCFSYNGLELQKLEGGTLEDPRLSRMYAALLARRFAELRRSTWRLVVMRSGLLTMIALTIVFVALAFGWRAHRLGQFAKLKSELKRGSVAQSRVPAQR